MNNFIYEGTADIYITEKCNENCLFCSAKKGDCDVDINNFKEYVNNWLNYGVKHINITGGEPLLYPNIIELIDYADSKGMNIALFTNGTLLQKVDYISILSKIKWLAISIDGNNESNTKLGRGNKHFELAFEALKIAKKFPELKIRVASIVTKSNQDQIIELGQKMIAENIIPDLWRIKQIIPVRRAITNWSELSISDTDYNAFVEELLLMYGKKIRIKPNRWKSKSGDLIVTYPSGDSGVTIISDNGYTSEIVNLGNIFEDFDEVLKKWYQAVNGDRMPSINYMDEAWNKYI